MNKALFLIAASGAMLLSSCTGSKYASTTEYDDVYYSKSDAPEVIVVESDPVNRAADNDRYTYDADRYRRPVDNYYDEYYADDDFYFSRRVRRFNNVGAASWRYYDPFYTNDLYFVMGSPYWNTWNNNGWYNWNYPRFGATFGWNTFGGYNGFYDPYFANSFSRWNSFNYYNPWVNAYYGYDPFFAPGWGNPYAAGFYNGFNSGFGPGFGSAYYCPPYGNAAFFGAPGVARLNNNTTRRATYRRPDAGGSAAQTNYTPASSRPNTSRTTAGETSSSRPTAQSASRVASSDNSQYLRPRTSTERVSRPTVPTTYSRPYGTSTTESVRTSGSSVRTSTPSSSTRTSTQSATRQPRVYTSPSSSTSPSRTVERSSRTSTPSYNTTPRRTYSAPSSSPSRTSSPSYNRSSSPSPSYNRSSSPSSSSPSRSSSPSSGSSSSRPSSSRR